MHKSNKHSEVHVQVICLQFTANRSALGFVSWSPHWKQHKFFEGGFFLLKARLWFQELLIHLPQLTGLICESCYMVNFGLKRMKKKVSGKAVWGFVPLPMGPGWFYLSVKHLGWTRTKGGAVVWSPEVFSLALECFQCGALSVRTFKGKRLFQKQESATNNMATHGPCWSCWRLLRCCRVLLPVARKEYT